MSIGEVIKMLESIFKFLMEMFGDLFSGNAEGEGEAEEPTV